MISLLKKHLTKCFVAGLVAILPIAGLVLTIVYFENQIAGVWLKQQGYYFFGMGVLLLGISLYLIGLAVTSLIGRWFFHRFDRLMDSLPILGTLYQTLKQLLGYGEGPNGLFKRVVWVMLDSPERYELGLVTCEASNETAGRIGIFLPNAPTPTSGKLIYLLPEQTLPTGISVNDAMQMLVSLGSLQTARGSLFSATSRSP
jgi:uncharacterized membrane protein